MALAWNNLQKLTCHWTDKPNPKTDSSVSSIKSASASLKLKVDNTNLLLNGSLQIKSFVDFNAMSYILH